MFAPEIRLRPRGASASLVTFSNTVKNLLLLPSKHRAQDSFHDSLVISVPLKALSVVNMNYMMR